MFRRRLSNGYSAVVSFEKAGGGVEEVRVMFFHSVIKSIRGKIIFYEDEDRLLFVNILRRFLDKHKIKLLEFVIMDNHIHLLHTAQSKELAVIFLSELQQNFAFWYNRFHRIEDKLFRPAKIFYKLTKTAIFQCAFYILQNPMNASKELYPHPKDYRWSSYYFHYNFFEKNKKLNCTKQSINRANTFFVTINNSRSKDRNACLPLFDNFYDKQVQLFDFLVVDTSFLDLKFTPDEFEILAAKAVVPELEELEKQEQQRRSKFILTHKDVITNMSSHLVELLDGRDYVTMRKKIGRN
jgi:Transposase IS200 like.